MLIKFVCLCSVMCKRDELLCNFHKIHSCGKPRGLVGMSGLMFARFAFFSVLSFRPGELSNVYLAKPHVTFKFMDISHEFEINNRTVHSREIENGWTTVFPCGEREITVAAELGFCCSTLECQHFAIQPVSVCVVPSQRFHIQLSRNKPSRFDTIQVQLRLIKI